MRGEEEAMAERVVERLRRDDAEAAAGVLADAFFDDPVLRFLAPDEAERRRWLPALGAAHVGLSLGDGHAYGVREPGPGGALAGVACLVPPGRYPPGPCRGLAVVRRAVLDRRHPPPALRHLARGLLLLAPIGRRHPRAPHWYVAMVGVAARRRGLGLGRALLGRAADLADVDRLPLYLETMTMRNVAFYESCGFEVVEHLRPHPDGPDCWTMQRPARR